MARNAHRTSHHSIRVTNRFNGHVNFRRHRHAAGLLTLTLGPLIPLLLQNTRHLFMASRRHDIRSPINRQNRNRTPPTHQTFTESRQVTSILLVRMVRSRPTIVSSVTVNRTRNQSLTRQIIFTRHRIETSQHRLTNLRHRTHNLPDLIRRRRSFTGRQQDKVIRRDRTQNKRNDISIDNEIKRSDQSQVQAKGVNITRGAQHPLGVPMKIDLLTVTIYRPA